MKLKLEKVEGVEDRVGVGRNRESVQDGILFLQPFQGCKKQMPSLPLSSS